MKWKLSVFEHELTDEASTELYRLLVTLDQGASEGGIVAQLPGHKHGEASVSPALCELLIGMLGYLLGKDGAKVFVVEKSAEMWSTQVQEIAGREGSDAIRQMVKQSGVHVEDGKPFFVTTEDFVRYFRQIGHPITE